jgi:Predicted oxidoreductases (related to aryl-alcohol dehydrogenases)
MEHRTLGSSQLSVSRVCLGTMTFGTPVPAADAVRLIRESADRGVNFIDTANMYEGYARVAGSSGGVAEEIVGEAIAGRREEFVVATKLGMKVGDAAVDEFTSPEAIRVQLDRSLGRLGTDYVDLYYLHKPDPHTAADQIVAALGAELEAGRIRAWGVSNYGVEELAGLIAAADELGVARPAACQPRLNLLDAGAMDALVPYCAELGISVIPYQGLAGGLLSGKYRKGEPAPAGSRGADKPDWVAPIDEDLQARLDEISAQAEEAGLTMAGFALRWLSTRAGVDSVLIGATRLSQVESAIAAVG